jgi:lipopolysaccharide export system protein LptC
VSTDSQILAKPSRTDGAGRADRGRMTAAMRRSRPAPVYSRLVRVFKILLPLIAAVILGLLAAWPRLAGHDERFQLGFSPIEREVDNLSMVNPRFFGLDRNNRPFAVTGDIATQADREGSSVTIESPQADVTLKDGAGVLLNADLGYYRQKEQILDLVGGVDLFHERGYEMHTTSARVDMKSGVAWGDAPVQGQGDFGTINAQGFRVAEDGQAIHFTGKSHLVLDPRDKPVSKAKPQESTNPGAKRPEAAGKPKGKTER